MDEQLKRRLVGAGIIVAVAVLVVPMFFEDKTQSGRDPSALPEPMEEHALPLPKAVAKPDQAAGPAALPEAGQKSAPASNRKFEVVPLVEAPPKPLQAAPEPTPVSEPAGGPADAPADADLMDEEPQPGSNPAPTAAPTGGGSAKAKPAGTAPTKKATTPSASGSQPAASAKPKTSAAESRKRTTSETRTPSAASKSKTSSSATKAATPPPSKSAPAAKTATPDRKSGGTPTPSKPAAPAKPKAATPRSDSGAGDHWTVQAGTFVEETNARNLAEKLRQRNLPVRVQTAEGASGKVYRVTVGPNLDRAKAERIQKQLATQDDVQGMILQTR